MSVFIDEEEQMPQSSWQEAAIRQLHHWCVAMDERNEAREVAERRADRIGELEAELAAVDRLLRSRAALDDKPDRLAKISYALLVAGRAAEPGNES